MKEKVTAIVLAAGKGSRMHSEIQKQYMTLLDRPVITYALEAFEKSSVDEIILVVAPGEIEYAQENILDKYDYKKVSGIITGGAERYDSVYKALCSMPEEGYVLIHDGARAFITPELIEFCIEQVKKDKSCVMGMPVKDTIKMYYWKRKRSRFRKRDFGLSMRHRAAGIWNCPCPVSTRPGWEKRSSRKTST